MPFQPFLSLPKQNKNRHWLWSACSLPECRIPTCQIVENYFAIYNRFLSRLAVYEGDFRGEEGLAAAIARIEARCNTEPSASTGVPPAVLFMREKEELRKVGSMGLLESMVADVSVQAVPPTMLVRCRGREFSVPRRCIGRRVKVLAMPSGQVRVEMAGETVAVRDLSAPGGPVVYDPAHYAEALAAKARYADADIEAAARANLELLGRLGEGSL